MEFFTLIIFISGFILLLKLVDNLLRLLYLHDFTNKYVFITGCDTGFGNLCAKRLDSLGCHVIASCLTEDGENELKASCSGNLKTIQLDVTKHDSVVKAFEFVKDILPPHTGLWGLVNNAGILGKYLGPIEFHNKEDYLDVFCVNCLGCVDVTSTFLPLVRKAKGRIINTSSIVGRFSKRRIAPYSISKYGIEAFSDNLRREMRPFDVSVHIIEPGCFATNLMSGKFLLHLVKSAWDRASTDIREVYGGEEALQKTLQFYVGMKSSENVNDVVNTYINALFSRFPRSRYVVGWDAKCILILQMLPEWLGDRLLPYFT